MIREDRELLAELARLNRQLVVFAWGVMDTRLSTAEHYQVASWLVDLAEAIQARSKRQESGVVEGEDGENGGQAANSAPSDRESLIVCTRCGGGCCGSGWEERSHGLSRSTGTRSVLGWRHLPWHCLTDTRWMTRGGVGGVGLAMGGVDTSGGSSAAS